MLLIDDRAGSERLLTYPALIDIAQATRLDAGDAMLMGNGPTGPLWVGVEVKSIHDLMSSINTGRFQATQLPGMLEAYDVRWLTYYGQYRPGRDGHLEIRKGAAWRRFRLGSREVPYGYLESMLFDIVAAGVNVRHCYDESEVAAWLSCLHRWWGKDWTRHKGLHAFDKSKPLMNLPHGDAGLAFRAAVAAQLPGLGFQKATTAGQHFDSVRGMINAEVGDWMRVPGVGKVLAKAITEAVK